MDDKRGRVHLERNGVRLDHDRESYIRDRVHFDSRLYRNPNVERGKLLHQFAEHNGNNGHLRDKRLRNVQRRLPGTRRNLLARPQAFSQSSATITSGFDNPTVGGCDIDSLTIERRACSRTLREAGGWAKTLP
jgi:hypothetical protein